MNACRYVGRVGGLAVALGVGAAVLGGTAAAWADDEAGASAGPARSAQSAPARQSRAHSESPAVGRPAPAGARAAATLQPAAPTRAAAGIVADRASAAVAVAATTPPADPSAPVTQALDATVLAAARRELQPAATVAPAAVASTPVASTPVASATVVPAAAQATALVMGPSGVPIPKQRYVDTVMEYYILPNSPAGTTAQVVFTPEGLYPITGVKSLPLNTSVDQGINILTQTMAGLPAGTETTVFGYSQSAIIGALLQENYKGFKVPADLEDTTQFIFVGNELNPDGGMLSRFPDLDLTSLGIPFYGGTPENAYRTFNYAQEYDGFADFPRYPMNFLSVLNAAMGIAFVHVKYADPDYLSIEDVTPISRGGTAIELPTTSILTQSYYFIRTENLPLLEPLRWIPIIGKPIVDLIQPALKVIVDLGYGDPAHGFETGTQPFANVTTPFGLFPDVSPVEVLTKFVAGIEQGIRDFINDFGPDGSVIREISNLRLPSFELPDITLPTLDGIIPAIQNLVLSVAEGISGSAATLYAALLPTADIVNAILTVLPGYNTYLVLDGVQQMLTGNILTGLVNALLMPVAADIGLITVAGLVGVGVWAQAITSVLGISIPDTA